MPAVRDSPVRRSQALAIDQAENVHHPAFADEDDDADQDGDPDAARDDVGQGRHRAGRREARQLRIQPADERLQKRFEQQHADKEVERQEQRGRHVEMAGNGTVELRRNDRDDQGNGDPQPVTADEGRVARVSPQPSQPLLGGRPHGGGLSHMGTREDEIGLVISRDAAMASSDGLKGRQLRSQKRRKMNRNIMPTMLP